MRIRIFALLSLAFLLTQANASTRVPMSIANNEYCSYFYGDYETSTPEPSRTDWWGTAEYSLTDEADDIDGTAAGTFIALDDADDLSWEYYSNTDIPVHSNGAVNIVVKYYGCGMNMVDNVEVTDLGISPVVANDGGNNVKAIFYRKTIEKENAEDTYYTYTTIPNPFSRRPVRTGITGNTKYLGFYAWAYKAGDLVNCSLAYADGGTINNQTINGETYYMLDPERKLNVTATEGASITLRALWDQAYVKDFTANTADPTVSAPTDAVTNSPTAYERNFLVLPYGKTSTMTMPSCDLTFSQLYPDGTDYNGCYAAQEKYIASCIVPISYNVKFEYARLSNVNNTNNPSFVKMGKTSSNSTNTNSQRIVMGRGLVMASEVILYDLYGNKGTSNSETYYNSNAYIGNGATIRAESGSYSKIALFAAVYNQDQQYGSMRINRNAEGNLTLGCDFDRWNVINGKPSFNNKLQISGDVLLGENIKFDYTGNYDIVFNVSVKSGTIGDASSDKFYMGFDLDNYAPQRYNNGSNIGNSLYAYRNVNLEGGILNSIFYGGRDGSAIHTATSSNNYNSSNTMTVDNTTLTLKNGEWVDVSGKFVKIKLGKNSISQIKEDFFGGDYVDFTAPGTTRFEITAQPRKIVILGGNFAKDVYGGSYYTDASSANSQLLNVNHLKALSSSSVSLYVGGNVSLTSGKDIFGGDGNHINPSVKSLNSVKESNIVVADNNNISIESVYGGGNGAGNGKKLTPGNNNIYLKNVAVTNVYGGFKGDASDDQIFGSSNITINGGTYTNVYGGGNGSTTHLSSDVNINVYGGTITSLYGGANQGSVGTYVNDSIKIDIENGTIGNVFGGGYRGINNAATIVNVVGGAVSGDVYGGVDGGSLYSNTIYSRGTSTVNVESSIGGNVYGGSKNAIDQVSGVVETTHINSNGLTEDFGLYHQKTSGISVAVINPYVMGGPQLITSLEFPIKKWVSSTVSSYSRYTKVYMYELTDDVIASLGSTHLLKYNDTTYYLKIDKQASEGSVNVSLDWKVDAAHKVYEGNIVATKGETSVSFDLDTPFEYKGEAALLLCMHATSGTTTSSGTEVIAQLAISDNDPATHKYGTVIYGGSGNEATLNWENSVASNFTAGQNTYWPRDRAPIINFGSEPLPNTDEAAAKLHSFVNVYKGSVTGSVFASGNGNITYGGVVANIGINAIANAPGHTANTNALANPTPGAITIGGSVYAGSNATGSWSYADADRSISGVSEVYLDGTGYDGAITIGGSKEASAGNIYGCSTNGEGGVLGSSVYISNIGSRNKEGKYLSATTWELGSVQHTDTLVLNNAHVTFNGAKQIEDDTKTNSVFGVHKIMRVVNNSTALLKADADSITKVGSYQCTDVYADSPVYTEVTAVSGASGKTQLTDCKNTIVFSNANLNISEGGTYGELQGYLYAVNTDSEHTATAHARQKKTDNSAVTGGTDNASDGGFVSYDATFNTYNNPTTDGYDGTGGKQEIMFTNVDGETYREWEIKASPLPNLWTEYVTSRPTTFPDDATITAGGADYIIPLTCEEDLAWFISYVNGFNGSSANPSAKAKLTADVDMGEFVWVPIGINSTTSFSGVFDGNYHTIDGIHIADATEVGYVEGSAVGTNGDMTHTGMFGYANGATIKNTFVMSGRLANTQSNGYLGGLVAYTINTNIELCETADTLTASAKATIGGIAGYMATESSNSNVLASMSTAVIDNSFSGWGSRIGGITGQSTDSPLLTISDCFSNVTFSGNTASYQGTICGWAYPKNCYMHKNVSPSIGMNLIYSMNVSYNLYAPTSFTSTATGKFSDAAAYQYGDYATNNVVTVGEETKPLVDKLNDNANANCQWIRPKGSMVINGGYPFVARKTNDTIMAVVGISNDKRLYYGEANDMIKKYGDNPNADIYVYSNGTLTTSPSEARLFIDENVAILQTAAAGDIIAHVGITFDNSKGTAAMHRDWHMFSSAIEKGKTGVVYGDQSMFDEFTESDMTFGTHYSLEQGNDSVYFPDGITNSIANPGKQFDIYSFYEPQYHWINLKRASTNHWHEDVINGTHPSITYTNEKTFTPGKGYLIALGDNADLDNNLMQARGTLNKGRITIPVTATGEHLTGYNLIGNPYQSYLDFNKFANANKNLWANADTIGYKSYLIYNADDDIFVEYLIDNESVGFSEEAAQGGDRYINMHQGFFIVKNGIANDAVFEDTMRVTNQTPHFRADGPHYPLVNLFCTDSDGKQEISVMEFERPLNAGSLKMKGMLNGKANMYIHWNGDDLGSVFINHMPDYVPVWFEAAEDGVFTITWNTANANFGYMHLIDNITGTDYDCLAPGNDSYTFHSNVNDMAARFRVVFKPLGIDEQEGENGENFAFINGEQLVVNGSGELSFIDLNGRVIMTQHVAGEQNIIALPNVAEGVYMLRLTNTNGVRVQKIVIKR